MENCCVERYKDSKQCGCCKKSRATVLDRIYWTTLKGKAKIHEVTNKIRSQMDDLLQSKVNASKFPVICDQYMEDNKDDPLKKYDLEIEMEVEINLGR